ncbi:DUF2130 domain-containing protein [Bradyrhizobium sp. AUGA SZCCT0176]|uniref:DUF2130 domain-containing protein n=1 Tax=Bradyrhizobium sp. AUGA SZCCT0176 TaxID=2807664 RepID=UPI001BA95AD1|nr:DUF2130 domain-containing protein [Bradyrhizobium sp. AUGA SZCCT0176]MBR1225230.1 DUF2130 domain-containing protein [Bradyrhizobium sp. AUGA SZCCT0176]
MPSQPSLFEAKALTPASKMSLLAEACPTCDQPIPHDRFEEIKARIQSRERKRSDEITARLQEHHARDKETALEEARKASEAKTAEAQTAGRRAAEVEAAERIAAVEQTNRAAQAQMRAELTVAHEATAGATAVIERMKEDAAERERAIRAEAAQAADAAAQGKLEHSERRLKEIEGALNRRIETADAAKAKAEFTAAALETALTKQRDDHAAALADLKQASAEREAEIRKELELAAIAAVQKRIEFLEKAKADAEAGAASATSQVEALQQAHQIQLQEERDVWQKAIDNAVNTEKAAAFEERLKIQTKFEDLKRAYEQKTAEELGEGAEIDLYEALKSEFEGDRIERINKGQPGADILHTVMHNGKECGKIIYDSKNHKQWRTEFATKLALDQMAAKAEHAVLSTSKFPKGARQLHVQDGVILAGPARVVALVQVIRRHLVQTHTLRLSSDERAQKTAALYDFITSERCADILARIDTHTDDLLELQVKEKKAHDLTWKRQGELIRSVQRVRAELTNEIDAIVGTADFGGADDE